VSFVLAFFGFILLIVLHELGHFAVAKKVGMRVERFSLFFPPLIARKKRGETEYAIGSIPLGGYVKISGMNPHEEIPPEVAHRAYYKQAVWKRIAVIAAGPAVNIALAFLILAGLFLVNGKVDDSVARVGSIEAKAPAEGKLFPGDELVAVDGKRGEIPVLSEQIGTHTCEGLVRPRCRAAEPARLTVLRDGRELTISVRPIYDAELERMRVGFGFARVFEDLGPGEASSESLSLMWEVTSGTVTTIVRIFDPEVRKDISGVVGTYEVTRQAFELDVTTALFYLALISLSLGVINLFPFLPLDGGHIFWALAEKIRGKAIPFSVLERAGFVGFALVMMLFAIGLSNDVGRITGEGFQIR
jgi:regulator of sigma E protease